MDALTKVLALMVLGSLLRMGGAAASAEGLTVVSSRWRADANPREKRHVWETAIWTEGWRELEQFYPEHFRASGSVHVILRNDTRRASSITLTHVDGQPVEEVTTTPERAGRLIWYRVESPQLAADEPGSAGSRRNVPPGEWVECSVRFREPPKESTTLRFALGEGQTLDVPVDVRLERVRIESMSFSSGIDRVYIYVRTMDGGAAPKGDIRLDGRDCTADTRWTIGPAGSGLALAEVALDPPWNCGTHHLVEVRLGEDETLAQPVRAWDNCFAIGLYGVVTPDKVKAAKEHGINTYFSGPSEILDDEKLDYVPPGYPGECRRRAVDPTGVLFYQNRDEPDAHDVKRGEAQPYMQRLGANAMAVVLPTQRDQRKLDPITPNLLLVDNTYKPLNWYVYGQIPDVFCTDPYAPLNGRQVDYVWKALEVARDASSPRPLISVLWACSLDDAKRKLGKNAPTPEEERIMAFYALGCGVKGIAYFIDMTTPTREGQFVGLSDIAPLWEEVGRINSDVEALAPYLSIGCPVGKPTTQGEAWTRALMCGRDNVVVVAVNTNHYIGFETRDEHSWNIPAEDVSIEIPLPPHFADCHLQEMRGGRLVRAKGAFEGGVVRLKLDKLVTARAFLISAGSAQGVE